MDQNKDQQRVRPEDEGQRSDEMVSRRDAVSAERKLEKNETLQDAGTEVPAYGRSSTNEESGKSSEVGEESIPLDNDETIGNP